MVQQLVIVNLDKDRINLSVFYERKNTFLAKFVY